MLVVVNPPPSPPVGGTHTCIFNTDLSICDMARGGPPPVAEAALAPKLCVLVSGLGDHTSKPMLFLREMGHLRVCDMARGDPPP